MRVFFMVGALCVVLFTIIIFSSEMRDKGLFEAIENDPTLWILVVATFLAFFSMYFNGIKFTHQPLKKKLFKLTRIGDLLFAVYLFVLNMIGFVDLIIRYIRSLNSPYNTSISTGKVVFFIVFISFSIAIFIDNLKFYKSLRNAPVGETIDDIGKKENAEPDLF